VSKTSEKGGHTTRARAVASRRRRNWQSAEIKLAELKRRLLEINDLSAAGAVLRWDHATYMPRCGATARARQGAIVRRLAHEKSVAPELGKLLDELEPYAATLPYESNEASLLRVSRRDFEKAIKVPSDYVARASAFGATAYDAWKRARPANDFATMVPFLERAIDIGREYADFFAPYEHVADPLIDDADEGMTTASIRPLFSELRSELVPIVGAISNQPVPDDGCLRGSFGEPAQLDFGLSVVKRIGYDFDRGRLDKTVHPFCTRLSAGDVRIYRY
jgi:carboxypeptidase Taq